jgi:hypothetical protein
MNGRYLTTHGKWSGAALAGVTLALMMPLMPVVVGAIELSFFDTHVAFQWLRTSAVEETIMEFYKELGWMF